MNESYHHVSVYDCMISKLFIPLPNILYGHSAPQFVIIYCHCCRQAQQPVLFCKHSSDPEKSVQHLCNIIVITQTKCTFLLNGGMTKTNQPAPRLCYCFHYTHLGPSVPFLAAKICFVTNWGPGKLQFFVT